ncbi:hypothetical protein MCOR22_003929 [Pyricularia oryzae]|nr:hypothetical protein MCOR22_003929 [Pyricularia oryzae]
MAWPEPALATRSLEFSHTGQWIPDYLPPRESSCAASIEFDLDYRRASRHKSPNSLPSPNGPTPSLNGEIPQRRRGLGGESENRSQARRLVRQPETRPIGQEQLVAEVKGIYAGLVMVENKCIEVDNAQSSLYNDSASPKLTNDQWQALIALHRALLHEHHDFFLASQHPSASPALRRLASKYALPARMWRHGIHSFLELLRHRLPPSLEYMLTFIYSSYSMMSLLYETIPTFEYSWIERPGGISRYRSSMAGLEAPTNGTLDHDFNIPVEKCQDTVSKQAAQLASKLLQPQLKATAAPGFQPLGSGVCSVLGLADGHPIAAVADTGAAGCFISSAYVKELGAVMTSNERKPVKLASGKTVKSIGSVDLKWLFNGESAVHSIVCHVVENLAHPLSLGRAFLEATSTLTTHKNRIIRGARKIANKLFRLYLLGEGLGKIGGYLDGIPTLGLPDTGSDIMAISTALAKRRGWIIDSSPAHRVQVQFADGSTVFTRGLVSGLDWDFGNGEQPVNCDFYVIDDLPVDAVLSSDFVFELDLFSSKYKAFFVQPNPWHQDDDGALFCNIRSLKPLGKILSGFFRGSSSSSPARPVDDLTLREAFSDDMVKRELDLRDEVDAYFSKLAEPERSERRDAEDKRRAEWDRWRDLHNKVPKNVGSQSGASSSPDGSGGRRIRDRGGTRGRTGRGSGPTTSPRPPTRLTPNRTD